MAKTPETIRITVETFQRTVIRKRPIADEAKEEAGKDVIEIACPQADQDELRKTKNDQEQ
ncbi:MAG TPA: hypothetical protein VK612_00480 [Pyrinomonadaceae bacterium]|nr:hypothetical protein [Pyrinomonadaceae bacterium]